MYRSVQEKSSFFEFTLRTKILKRELLRRKLREISRKFAQTIFFFAVRFRGETPRKLAEKLRELSWSFFAKFRADTPQKFGVIWKNVNSWFIFICLFNVSVNNYGHVETVS